jgi:hypothetical protein
LLIIEHRRRFVVSPPNPGFLIQTNARLDRDNACLALLSVTEDTQNQG